MWVAGAEWHSPWSKDDEIIAALELMPRGTVRGRIATKLKFFNTRFVATPKVLLLLLNLKRLFLRFYFALIFSKTTWEVNEGRKSRRVERAMC